MQAQDERDEKGEQRDIDAIVVIERAYDACRSRHLNIPTMSFKTSTDVADTRQDATT